MYDEKTSHLICCDGLFAWQSMSTHAQPAHFDNGSVMTVLELWEGTKINVDGLPWPLGNRKRIQQA
jgi:hypothetical protein